MTNWMYLTVQNADATQLGLDEFGRKGWELVSVVFDGGRYSAFLKRPANIGSLPQQVAQQEQAARTSYGLSNDRATGHAVTGGQPATPPTTAAPGRLPTKRAPQAGGNT